MPKYRVFVSRVAVAATDFEVEADDPELAREKAEEEARNTDQNLKARSSITISTWVRLDADAATDRRVSRREPTPETKDG